MKSTSSMGIGILAFGSIVEEPGAELAAAVSRRIEVETLFSVEFARSSRTRDGAPTLVPVSRGGACIPASVLVLDNSVSVTDAHAMLYRRETGRMKDIGAGAWVDWIGALSGIAGIGICLYTALGANIRPPLTAEKLAELALRSAVSPSGAKRRDGISYLMQQKRRGIDTPLMRPYEEVVRTRTGSRNRADSPAVVQTITAQAGSHCVHAGHLNRVELRSPAAYKNDLGTIDKVSAAATHATPYPPGETGRTPRKHHPSGALVAVH